MKVIATRLLKEAKGNEGLIENLIGAMPRERVLTETDGPFAAADGKPLAPGDVGRAREALSDCWGVAPDEVMASVLAAFRRMAASPVGGPAASA